MGDTTYWELFGVPLKLVAVQDPGNRDSELWEAFDLNEREDSALIGRVVQAAVEGRPGLQIVTDQGTPYVSAEARASYEEVGLEHLPAREGCPTDKAPLERSFGIVKPILVPLVRLSALVAEKVEGLFNGDLARVVGKYLVAAVLNAYRLGRAARQDGNRPGDPELLRAIAAEQVRRARDACLSRKQLLERLHDEYQMEGSRQDFVQALRRYAQEDLEEAERQFRAYACRCAARNCDRYFVAIARRIAEEAQARRRLASQRQLECARQEHEQKIRDLRDRTLDEYPEARVTRGLDLIAAQWLPPWEKLYNNGYGIGTRAVLKGLKAIQELVGPDGILDKATVIWQRWVHRRPHGTDRVTAAVKKVWDRLLNVDLPKETGFPTRSPTCILSQPPLLQTPRSPP